MNNLTESSALSSLIKKGAIIVEPEEYGDDTNLLSIPRNSLGNGSLGKLSFLKNYCGWRYFWSRSKFINQNRRNK